MTPKQLSQWLKKHKLTASDATDILCKNKSTISRMLSGKSKITDATIQLMKLYDKERKANG